LTTIKDIANGNESDGSFNGIEWNIIIHFGDKNFNWQGKFKSNLNSNPNSIFGTFNSIQSEIEFEKISVNGNDIVKRNGIKVTIENQEIDSITLQKSLLNIFSSNNDLKPLSTDFDFLHSNWNKGFFINAEAYERMLNTNSFMLTPYRFDASSLYSLHQLYFIKDKLFFDILSSFKSIFPTISDIDFEILPNAAERGDIALLRLKDNGIWVTQNLISLGMLKTLQLLVKIKTTPPEAVVLIDEFENSLGINCIDKIADELMNLEHPFQMIFTSHHADIISKIPVEHWRIVQRKGSVVKLHKAEEFKIGTSKHSAYSNLLNNPQFEKSIQ
jgi:hypothetical protein